MKLKIVYRDNEPPTVYEHVAKVTIVPHGLGFYHITNGNGALIAEVPVDVIRRIENVDGDTDLVIATQKIELS